MIADDLFAGAGGWDLAAARLGIHARGVENMKEARATREAAGLTTIHDDVWTYQPDGNAAGLIASPPCQTFSQAGKGVGRKALEDVLRGIRDNYATDREHLRFLGLEVGDERTALVLTPLHFALTGGYEWLAWEQVPTVLPVWEACAEVLRRHGWHVWTGKLNAEQYGDPQTRTRAFLAASRSGPVAPPVPTHSRYYSRSPGRLDAGVHKWVSMAEALGWGMTERSAYTVTGGGTETGGAEVFANGARKGMERERAAGSWTPHELERNAEFAAMGDVANANGAVFRFLDEDEYAEWLESRDKVAVEGDGSWTRQRPSPTVVGSFAPDVVAKPGYRKAGDPPRQKTPGSVRVTVQEAGILQSFPADYPWQGAKSKQFLQAGNAVPPGMALAALSAAADLPAERAA